MRCARVRLVSTKEIAMTAPDTNLSKQTRRHRGPLLAFGLIAVVVLAVIVVFSSVSTDSQTVLIEGTPSTTVEN